MKIIHTSDWHLGKNLEGFSRLEEQKLFLDDFVDIVKENDIDLVIIAGDIYDNSNPPAKAEQLFYKTLNKICDGGKRIVLIISGNHDNPERLVAASPLAKEQGIIMIGLPKSVVDIGNYGTAKVIESDEGYIELDIKGERVVIITLPYPSEKRLNEILSEEFGEEEKRKRYSDKIGDIFNKLSEKYREDTINIATSHLFVWGSKSSDSERPIELGGSLAVESNKLPKKAQYIALGHLHRCQKVENDEIEAYYSGSPIQYSKSERGYVNCCYIIDLKPKHKAKVSTIMLKNYKPIEVWKCENIQYAIDMCKKNKDKNVWVYMEIYTDEPISQEDIKLMKELKKDIIEIKPIIKNDDYNSEDIEDFKEKSMKQLFQEFYRNQRGMEPKEELMDLFLSIANEGEEENEA